MLEPKKMQFFNVKDSIQNDYEILLNETVEQMTLDKKEIKVEDKEMKIEKLRSQVSAPFLPPLKEDKMTLVLDLDETLVHYVEENDCAFIQVRPGAEDFIEDMSQYYELVIFTAAMQDYADLVLDQLDQNKLISHRLYRQHTKMFNSNYIKDISLLGRCLSKTLIVDNIPENFQLQKENGVHIKNFEGCEEDIELQILGFELKRIAVNKLDLIKELPYLRSQLNQ